MENGSHVTEGGNHSRWEWMTAFRKWFVAAGISVVVGVGFGAWSVRDQWWHWFFPPKLQFIVKPPDTPYSENSLIKFTLTDEFDEPLTGEYKCKFFMNNVPAGQSAGCAKENAVAVPEKVINDSGDQDKVEIRLYVIAKNEAGRDVLWTTARVVVLRERQLVIEPANPKVGAPGTVELRARISAWNCLVCHLSYSKQEMVLRRTSRETRCI